MMRLIAKFLLLVSICLCAGASAAWADDIVDVSILGGFVATQPCVSNCIESVDISFQFDATEYPAYIGAGDGSAMAVPGTVSVNASGFLGSFESPTYEGLNGFINIDEGYMPFLDAYGDELDIRFPLETPFAVGIDTITMEFWGTHSPEYYAYLSDCCSQLTSYASTIVPASEPPTWLLLGIGILLLAALRLKSLHFFRRSAATEAT